MIIFNNGKTFLHANVNINKKMMINIIYKLSRKYLFGSCVIILRNYQNNYITQSCYKNGDYC